MRLEMIHKVIRLKQNKNEILKELYKYSDPINKLQENEITTSKITIFEKRIMTKNKQDIPYY